MIQLRKAKKDDANSVAQILSSSRREYLSFVKSPHSDNEVYRWVRDILISNSNVVIARWNDRDAGILATSISDNFSWIDQLYVAPGCIGEGIGTELLGCAMNQLPAPIRLWTFQQNKRAIRFYQYYGFRAIKYTNGENNEEKCPDVLLEYSL